MTKRFCAAFTLTVSRGRVPTDQGQPEADIAIHAMDLLANRVVGELRPKRIE